MIYIVAYRPVAGSRLCNHQPLLGDAWTRTTVAMEHAQLMRSQNNRRSDTGVFCRSLPRLCFLCCVVHIATVLQNTGMGVQFPCWGKLVVEEELEVSL
jgi:hypothetical protein